MKFSGLAISNIAWPAGDDTEALDRVAAAGFTGVEVAPARTFGDWDALDLAQVRRTAADFAARGLPIVAMQAITFGVHGIRLFGSPAEREALARHLRRVAEIAGACGGVPCVFGAPAIRDPGDIPANAALERAADFLARIAPSFAANRSSLAFEAVPSAYHCRFVTHTGAAVALVRRIASPGLGLQIDAGTVLLNEEPLAILAEATPLAVHCHASAPHLAPVAPYAGAHARLAMMLRSAGWRGWVSVEMRTAPDWRSAIAEAGIAMREAWL